MTEEHPFKWRHYEAEIILLCIRWYLRVRHWSEPILPVHAHFR